MTESAHESENGKSMSGNASNETVTQNLEESEHNGVDEHSDVDTDVEEDLEDQRVTRRGDYEVIEGEVLGNDSGTC
jgi:hypothetical protein